MKLTLLKEENLLMLGILEQFYNFYTLICEDYNSTYEAYKEEIPNGLSRFDRVCDHLIKPIIRPRLKKFLEDYTYLFTSEYKTLYLNSSFVNEFCQKFSGYSFHNNPSKDFLNIRIYDPTFKEFLLILEASIIHLLWDIKLKKYSKVSIEYIERELTAHFEGLLKDASNIFSSNSLISSTTSELLVFKNLSSISCNLKGHCVEPFIISVELLDTNENVFLQVHKCKDCGRIFIGNESLKLYKKKYGELLIATRKDTYTKNDYEVFAGESKLHKLGYNVISGIYSEQQRHNMLIKLYEKGFLSVFEIERDLENAIRIFKYRSQYQLAVSKWENDLEFFQSYIISKEMDKSN